MRAILIDPTTREITEVQIKGDLDSICQAIGCRSFTIGAILNGSYSKTVLRSMWWRRS